MFQWIGIADKAGTPISKLSNRKGTERQTDKQTDRQTDRQQTHRPADNQTDGQTPRPELAAGDVDPAAGRHSKSTQMAARTALWHSSVKDNCHNCLLWGGCPEAPTTPDHSVLEVKGRPKMVKKQVKKNK